MRSLAAVACLLVASFPVLAQGSGAPAGPDWCGVSAGMHIGGGWGSSTWTDANFGDVGSHSASGALGGLQVGFDSQSGDWVWGARADLSLAGIEGSHQDTVFTFGPAPQTDRGKIDLFGTITARLGHAWGPALVSVRAGAVWAHARYSLEGYYAPGLEFSATGTTRWGWTAGLGLEYGLAGPWAAFLEYDYLALGTKRVDMSCTTASACALPGNGPVPLDVRENFNVVKVGIGYRF